MTEASQSSIPTEHGSTSSASIAFRTEVKLSDDDLSEQAKEQFSNHTKVLRVYQTNAHNILIDNRLSPAGRHLYCLTVEQNYTNYKNVLNYVAAHPELKTTTHSIRPPLIICGLGRTGTSLLYNLLACDSACRAPLLMDMLMPVPPLARSDTSKQTERSKIADAYNGIFKALGLNNYEHEIRASHPFFMYEEDCLIFAQAGLDWPHYFIAPHKNNEFVTWCLDKANKDFAYEYHRTFMQMLNSVDPPQSHWLLKSGVHMFYIDTLLRYYPMASLIITHRRLDDVLPSSIRLAIAYASGYLNSNEADIIANKNTSIEIQLHMIDAFIRRLIEFRRTNRDTPVLDILYDDLVAQPIDTVHRIYEYFGLTWSEEFELAMLAWLRNNPQGKQGRNNYTLEEFGLEHEAIEKRYEEYNRMFLKTGNQS